MFYYLLIVNKNGSLIYDRSLNSSLNLSQNETINIASIFYSMHAISAQLTPPGYENSSELKLENHGIEILESIYDDEKTKDMLWEDIYIRNLNTLKMKIRRYPKNDIFEFDTLDELRLFDPSYIEDTSSAILKQIAKELHIQEKDIHDIKPLKTDSTKAVGFLFKEGENTYQYTYQDKHLEKQS